MTSTLLDCYKVERPFMRQNKSKTVDLTILLAQDFLSLEKEINSITANIENKRQVKLTKKLSDDTFLRNHLPSLMTLMLK